MHFPNVYHAIRARVRHMKDIHTKERFIELRGQGLSLAAIAAEIGVSKPTLINWERDLKERIDNVQAVLHPIRSKVVCSIHGDHAPRTA